LKDVYLKNNEIGDAYEFVMDAIVTQKLKPSQKVTEKIISDMFYISRSTSKTLIEQLVAKHFLVSLSPRVTQVAQLTLFEFRQNFHLRKLLLSEVVSLSADKVDFDKLIYLNEEVRNMLPIEDNKSALNLLKKNKQINLLLSSKSEYPIMFDWVAQLEDTAMRYYWLYIKTQNSFSLLTEQQETLFKVMKTGNSKKIHSVTLVSLEQTEKKILKAILSHEQFYTQNLLV
jgi:DNA-binding GntR family transcriptional regulator